MAAAVPANANAPFGFKAIRHRLGIQLSGAMHLYEALATYGTAIFIGDPVVRVAGGSNAALVNAGIVPHKIATLGEVNVAAGSATSPVTGVVVGFEPDPNGLGLRQHRLASTSRVIHVIDDPYVEFIAQEDGSTALAAASVGLNALIDLGTAGNAITGISGAQIDTNGTAPGADATYPLRILRLHDRPGNSIGDNAIYEVAINLHTERSGVVGI